MARGRSACLSAEQGCSVVVLLVLGGVTLEAAEALSSLVSSHLRERNIFGQSWISIERNSPVCHTHEKSHPEAGPRRSWLSLSC